ncbi:hypothetical protein ACP70R_002517 [Stipagrostis hirtigluma subsp. patula]
MGVGVRSEADTAAPPPYLHGPPRPAQRSNELHRERASRKKPRSVLLAMAAAASAVSEALADGGAAAVAEDDDDPAPCAWPPAVAARYERLGKMGEGIFGDVYAARDRADARLVAVKRLAGRTDARFVKTGLREFAREAMSLGACRGHPSVVELLATFADSRRSDGDCFVVTAFAGRLNLRRYMALRRREGRPFREAEVRGVMRQLLAGVERAHAAGVLHRDIEPENVLVDDENAKKIKYRICGFGLSEPAALAGKDEFSTLAASSPYRAPELFLGSKEYDGRIDTWGLGCIMADLLAGAGKPFFSEPPDKVLQSMLATVGARGIKNWPGLQRLPAARDPATELVVRCSPDAGRLREAFPESVLSKDGFEVLSGLLESSPERRLTAAAALKKPWFRARWRRGLGLCLNPRVVSP